VVDHVQSWSTLKKGHGLPCYSMVCRHVISCFDLKPQIPCGVVVLDERNNLKVALNSLKSVRKKENKFRCDWVAMKSRSRNNEIDPNLSKP